MESNETVTRRLPTPMADVMDPQAVEEQSQAEQENYKVYKRRWLVLFAMFSVSLTVGLHRSLISIVDVLKDFMNIDESKYDLMTQVSMFTILISVFGSARALDHFGLRRVAYVACLMILCANGLKALCCSATSYVPGWLADSRFQILLLSEFFVGLAQSIALCVPAKVASAWFAHYENTLALVIANCGYNIGVGFSNYFTPIFITSVGDMYKLSIMFLISGILVVIIVAACVTRSSPKMPPSSNAMASATNVVPLRSGLAVMLSNSNYLLLLTTLNLNSATLGVEQLVLEDILNSQNYSDSFCGALIAHAYFFGTFFMLMAAAWIDNSANYVKVSRIASITCALSLAVFNISIIIPNIKNVILFTNVIASFGASLAYPALFQVSLRSAVTILPEATVSAIVIVLQQVFSGILMNLLGPLKKLSVNKKGYQAPLIIFSSILIVVNILYTTTFRAPSRDDLQRQLRSRNHEILVDEGD